MKKSFSDRDITYKSQDNEHYDECSMDDTKEEKDLGNCTSHEFDPSLHEFIEKNVENKDRVAEKVEGVTSLSRHLFAPSSNGCLDSTDTNSTSVTSSDADLNKDSLNSNTSSSSRIDLASLNLYTFTDHTADSEKGKIHLD